jgi:hypothetical protein
MNGVMMAVRCEQLDRALFPVPAQVGVTLTDRAQPGVGRTQQIARRRARDAEFDSMREHRFSVQGTVRVLGNELDGLAGFEPRPVDRHAGLEDAFRTDLTILRCGRGNGLAGRSH